MPLKPEEIKWGNVYSSAMGERRLVTSVQDQYGARPVVLWRTAESELKPTQKAHGSCTLSSFLKWAETATPATKADWAAYEDAQRQRRWRNSDNRAIAAFRKRLNKV